MNTLPAGACDCHMHVFDDRYPIVQGAKPVPAASPSRYLAVRARLGLTRTVVVAPSTYGLDNRATLDGLAALGAEARAVVAPPANPEDATLENLHRAGVRGIRFNLARGNSTPIDQLVDAAQRIAPLGWHVQLMLTPAQLLEHGVALRGLPVPLVIDHMARIPQDGGTRSPAWAVLLGLVDAGNTWVKLSLASSSRLLGTPAEADLHATGRGLVEHAPGRLLWGSDWPHVLATQDGVSAPPEEQLLAILLDWAGSETARHAILVDTPASVYGFTRA